MGELIKKWTKTAKAQLKLIYQTHQLKSLQTAQTIKNEILQATKEIHFVEQYQRDEVEPEFRRIIVRYYKILYIEVDKIVFIARIYDTRQNPNRQIE